MQRILNQDEIDALFRAAGNSRKDTRPATRFVTDCNFRKAGQMSREHMQAISGLHEAFARQLSYSMGAYLRSKFDVNLVSVEQLVYSEFLGRLPEVAYAASANVQPFDSIAVLQMDMALAFPVVDLLLGGRGAAGPVAREITAIEEQILETVARIICRDLENAWEPIGLGLAFGARQPQAQLTRIHASTERVLALSFEIRMQESSGMLNLALPATVSAALIRKLSQQWVHRKSTTNAPMGPVRDRLQDCVYDVELSLTSMRVQMGDLVAMQPGQVLPLNRPVKEPATLSVAGVPLFTAEPARAGNHKAARLSNAIRHSSPEFKEVN